MTVPTRLLINLSLLLVVCLQLIFGIASGKTVGPSRSLPRLGNYRSLIMFLLLKRPIQYTQDSIHLKGFETTFDIGLTLEFRSRNHRTSNFGQGLWSPVLLHAALWIEYSMNVSVACHNLLSPYPFTSALLHYDTWCLIDDMDTHLNKKNTHQLSNTSREQTFCNFSTLVATFPLRNGACL